MSCQLHKDSLTNWKEGMHIQHAMGNLTADQREFLISGIAIGTWDEIPPEEEDESDPQLQHDDQTSEMK
jgi:hypothetical protein